MHRPRSLRGWLAGLLALALLASALLALAAVYCWRMVPTQHVLAWRLAWEDRLGDPTVLQREYPRLGFWLGRQGLLQDRSLEAESRRIQRLEVLAAHARRLGCAQHLSDELEDCLVLQRSLQDRIERARWPLHAYRLNPMFGEHLTLAGEILGDQRRTGADAAAAVLARADAAGLRISEWQAWVQAQREVGVRPPRRMLAAVIRQIEENQLAPTDQQSLMRGFDAWLAQWPATGQARWRKQLAQVLAAQRGDWLRLVELLRLQWAESPQDFGAWSQPEGDAYYRHALLQHTSLPLDPEQVAAWGQVEVDRLETALHQRLDLIGIAADVLDVRIDNLRAASDPDPLGSLASAEVVQRFEAAMRQQEPVMRALWPAWSAPPVRLSVAGAERGPQAPLAAYFALPQGGTMIQLAVRDRAEWIDWMILPLVRHEYLPGHHLQWTLQQDHGLPEFRRTLNWSAFSEGWAMYAEGLQLAGQPADTLQQIGLLHSELLRAARMVVDPGVHYLRWSRSEAVDYLRRHAALTQRDAESEVDRYFAWPGQAVAFGVGLRHIRSLRAQAAQRLGARFDEADFARALVKRGAVPLQLLDARMARWARNRESESGAARIRDAGTQLGYAWDPGNAGSN